MTAARHALVRASKTLLAARLAAWAGHAAATQNLELVADSVPAANVRAQRAPLPDDAIPGLCTRQRAVPGHGPRPGPRLRVRRRRLAVLQRVHRLCIGAGRAAHRLGGQRHLRRSDRPRPEAPPKYTELGATVVVAGGGDGVIAGGTGAYATWTGTFSDRVFVGFGAPTAGFGGIAYCDQLWCSISGK